MINHADSSTVTMTERGASRRIEPEAMQPKLDRVECHIAAAYNESSGSRMNRRAKRKGPARCRKIGGTSPELPFSASARVGAARLAGKPLLESGL